MADSTPGNALAPIGAGPDNDHQAWIRPPKACPSYRRVASMADPSPTSFGLSLDQGNLPADSLCCRLACGHADVPTMLRSRSGGDFLGP